MDVRIPAGKVKVKTGLMGMTPGGGGILLATGHVTDGTVPTTDNFSVDLPSQVNDFYSNAVLVFTTGACKGITTQVVGYTGKVISPPSDGVIYVNQPGYPDWNTLPIAPAVGDSFSLYAGGQMKALELMHQYLNMGIREKSGLLLASGVVTNDTIPDINGFSCDLTDSNNGAYDNNLIMFTSGAMQDKSAYCCFYMAPCCAAAFILVNVPGATAFPMPIAPAVGDAFNIYAGGAGKVLTIITQELGAQEVELGLIHDSQAIHTFSFAPGLQDSGNLAASPITITASAEPSTDDWSCTLTIPQCSSPDYVQLIIGTRLDINIDADSVFSAYYQRVYVDVIDSDHLLYDLEFTTTGDQPNVQDSSNAINPTIFALLTDGNPHTFHGRGWRSEVSLERVGYVEPTVILDTVELWESTFNSGNNPLPSNPPSFQLLCNGFFSITDISHSTENPSNDYSLIVYYDDIPPVAPDVNWAFGYFGYGAQLAVNPVFPSPNGQSPTDLPWVEIISFKYEKRE